MPASPLSWLQWLEDSEWSSAIRQSAWLYPALEIVHIIGIVLLVGSAFLFDIRMLGFSRNIPISALERHLLTWSMRAVILVIPSGILLFITNATALGHNPVFYTKLIVIFIAAINAWIFHKIILKTVPAWNTGVPAPASAKITALVSIIAWITVIACGRLLAY
jgi:hypothetical protein